MREFPPGISQEICMFFRIPRKIGTEVGKTGKALSFSCFKRRNAKKKDVNVVVEDSDMNYIILSQYIGS
jgi:hypothetical protein